MPTNTNIFKKEFQTRPVAYAIQVVGIIVILLNVWLGTKLVPLAKDLDTLMIKVQALEAEHLTFKEDGKTDEIILGEIKTINSKIDDIRARVERIDLRLSKHLGI